MEDSNEKAKHQHNDSNKKPVISFVRPQSAQNQVHPAPQPAANPAVVGPGTEQKTGKKNPMEDDEIENYTGKWGWYQLFIVVLMILPCMLTGAQILSLTFTVAVPKHRCFIPGFDNENNATYQDVFSASLDKNLLGPMTKEGGKDAYCSYCPPGAVVATRNGTNATCADSGLAVECTTHVYDRSQYKSSLSIKFNGVCSHGAYKKDLMKTFFMIGKLIGAFACGVVSDKIGRKPVMLACALLGMVTCNVIVTFNNFWLVCCFMTINGIIVYGMFLSVFVIVMELLGGIYRTVVGIWVQGFFAFGYLYLGWMAYMLRRWEDVQLSVSLPFLFIIPYYWLIPESIRWQIVNGKVEQAKQTVMKVAKFNKKKIDVQQLEEDIHKLANQKEEKASIVELFKHKFTAYVTLIVFFAWFAVGMGYYGISYNTEDLPGSDYTNFILMGVSELPAYVLCIPMMEKLGRRPTLMISMIFGGIACAACGFIPNSLSALILTLAFIGKMGVSAAFAVIYNYSAEIFPTVVRHSATGASSTIARVGSGLAPQIHLLANYTAHWVPFFIYGMVACLSGFVDFFLPETKDEPLPETIEDTLDFGVRNKKRKPENDMNKPQEIVEQKTLV